MGEPRRWKLTRRGRGVTVKRNDRSLDAEWLCQGECVCVREDRATETDREKIARRLAEYAAHELGLEVEVLDHHFETADELLALVLGEASRV